MSPQFDLSKYEEVKDRIPRFYESYPGGRITTRIVWISDDASRVVIEASLYANLDEQMAGCPIATGMAEETQGVGMVNKTAHIENCETSAIGRAIYNSPLAEAGVPRPSREEMEKVQRAQEHAAIPETVSLDDTETLRKKQREFFAACRELGIDPDDAKNKAKALFMVESFNDLSVRDLREAYLHIKAEA